jgi:glutamyl-tRNA(Gln) amidotransferase subunit D
MNVYNTGRDLINAGAICVYDMLPETAYVKHKWALGKTQDMDEVKRIMVTPVVGEMSDRREF